MKKRSIAVTMIATLLIASSAAFALANSTSNASPTHRSLLAEKNQRFNGSVTAINGNTITMKDAKGKTWTLDVSKAKLSKMRGEEMKVEDIKVSDKIEIRGTASGTNIDPQTIKNKTLGSHRYAYTGMVQSVSGSTIITKGKTLGVKTVITNDKTTFTSGKDTISLSDIPVGSKIKITGTWERSDKTITATKVQLLTKPKKN